jgi:hypothetical protein
MELKTWAMNQPAESRKALEDRPRRPRQQLFGFAPRATAGSLGALGGDFNKVESPPPLAPKKKEAQASASAPFESE